MGVSSFRLSRFPDPVAGEYSSGRFALRPYLTDPGEALMARMIGRRLQRYNPGQPQVWFLPDEFIDGRKVEQDLGPNLVSVYPKE
jgi:hypothetical protein